VVWGAVDSAIYAGYRVPPYYDSMIAKLIVHAPTREGAINRLRRALDEFAVVGIKTTLPLHRRSWTRQNFNPEITRFIAGAVCGQGARIIAKSFLLLFSKKKSSF